MRLLPFSAPTHCQSVVSSEIKSFYFYIFKNGRHKDSWPYYKGISEIILHFIFIAVNNCTSCISRSTLVFLTIITLLEVILAGI